MKNNNRQNQSGQSLIYIIGFVPVLILALLYVYNANMAVNEKTRLQNTMDAVAFSAATISAREYNFKAYTNRIMVANQVGIAQAVGLQSWIRHIDVLVRNSATVVKPIPIIGQIFAVLERVSKTITPIMETLMSVLASTTDGLVRIISASQFAFSAASFILASDVANTVAKANDADVDELSLISGTNINLSKGAFAANQAAALRFTSRFNPDKVSKTAKYPNGPLGSDRAFNAEIKKEDFNRSEEFRNITMESLDGFSKERNHRIAGLIVNTLEKRGGTSLLGNDRFSLSRYGSWAAVDTMSFHVGGRLFGIPIPSKEIVPLGWGAARNGKNTKVKFLDYARVDTDYFGAKLEDNKMAATLAAKEFQRKRLIERVPFMGLQAFYDLTVNGLISRGPKLRLILGKPTAKVRTSGQIGIGKGSVNLEERAAGTPKLYSMAASAAVFSRINEDDTGGYGDYVRADGLREYGSLYNPYWQARLEKLPILEKGVMQAFIVGTALAQDIMDLEP